MKRIREATAVGCFIVGLGYSVYGLTIASAKIMSYFANLPTSYMIASIATGLLTLVLGIAIFSKR
jgi:hypothetical protein